MGTKINLDFSIDAIKKESFERGKRAGQKEFNKILDKIREEIESLNPVDYVSMSSYEGHRGASDMQHDVLRIIDKYEESEGI